MFINCDNLSGYVTIKILPSRHTSRYVARIIGYVGRITAEKLKLLQNMMLVIPKTPIHSISFFDDIFHILIVKIILEYR